MSFYDALLFSKGQRGERGYSAYEIAVQNGYEGTEEEWANSFLSPTGYYTKAETDNKLKKKAYYFDNVASMKSATNLKDGDFVITLGYYAENDGGSADYLIRAKTNADVEDNGSIHFIGNTLVAELIVKDNTINVKQFGAKIDNQTDDSTYIQNAIDYIHSNNLKKSIVINKGTYLINNTINLYYNVKLVINGEVTFNSYLKNNEPVLNLLKDSTSSNCKWITGSARLTIVNKVVVDNNDDTTKETIAVKLQATNDLSISDISIDNLNLRDFNVDFFLKSINIWNIKFSNCIFFNSNIGVLYSQNISASSQSLNAGERISFENCLFTQNKIDVKLWARLFSQMNFHNCSFDFSDCMFYVPYKTNEHNAITSKISLNQCHIEGISNNVNNPTSNYGILYLDNYGYDITFSIVDSTIIIYKPYYLFIANNGDYKKYADIILNNIYFINNTNLHYDNCLLSKNLNIISNNLSFRKMIGTINEHFGVRFNTIPISYNNIINRNPFLQNLTIGNYSKSLNTEVGEFLISESTGISSIVCEDNSTMYTNAKKLKINYNQSYDGTYNTMLGLTTKNYIPISQMDRLCLQIIADYINRNNISIILKYYNSNKEFLSETYDYAVTFVDTELDTVTESLTAEKNPPKEAAYCKIEVKFDGGKTNILETREFQGIMLYKI